MHQKNVMYQNFKIRPIYQIDNYSLRQIEKTNFLESLRSLFDIVLNLTIYMHIRVCTYMCVLVDG